MVKRKVSMCSKMNRRNLHAEWKLLVLNRWCFIPFGQTWTKMNESIQGDLPIQNRYFSILHAGWCILLVKFCLHSEWIFICSEWLWFHFLINIKDSRCRSTILRNFKKTNQKRTGYVSILNGGFSVLQGASLFQFFLAKSKRQKKDWGLLHSSAEKCWKWKEKAKSRFRMETVRFSWITWTIHSQKMKKSPTKKQRNPQNDILFHSNLVQKGNVVWTRENSNLFRKQVSSLLLVKLERFAVERKRTENFPTKKKGRNSFFWWKRKKHSWKKNIENLFNQKKKWRNHHSEWRFLHFTGENPKIAAEKKWRNLHPKKMNREISIQKQKKVFSTNYFWSKKHSWFANKHVNFQKKWMKIHSGKKSEWRKCPGKKNRYTFQKKFKTLLKKNWMEKPPFRMEKSPFTFFE